MASANFHIRINAGSPVYTATVVADDVVSFHADALAGWQSARWKILGGAYPPDFPCPAGWSTDGSTGDYYYDYSPIGGAEPPDVTMPNNAAINAGQWGTWIFDLVVNGSVQPEQRCGVEIVSPNLGLHDTAFSEAAEFGGAVRQFIGPQQGNNRLLDTQVFVPGAYVASLATATPLSVSAATGPITLSWNPTANFTAGGFSVTSCTGLTNASGAVTISAGSGALALSSTTGATITRQVATSGATATVCDVIRTTAGAGANGDGAQLRFRLPDVGSTLQTAAFVSAEWVNTAVIGGPSSQLLLGTTTGGTLYTGITLSAAGAVRFNGAAYASAGGRFVVDGSGNITLQAITEAELRTAAAGLTASLAVNSQKITDLAAGAGSGEAVEYDQLNTALGGYVPTSRTITAGAGLTGGGDLSADRTIDVAAADASITVNANSIEASGNFVAKAITTTSSVTAGASGLIAPKWDRASAGALTLGGTNATSVACSGLGLTGVASVGNAAGALALTSGAGNASLDSDAGSKTVVGATSTQVEIGAAAVLTVAPSLVTSGKRVEAPRFTAAPSTPASAGAAVTFNLATSQNVKHSTTEATTVTFSNAVEGMAGYIEFIQGGTGYTVTMPTNGVGVEYSNAIAALTTTGIVDATANTRTMLRYYVTGSPAVRVVIDVRAVSTIP